MLFLPDAFFATALHTHLIAQQKFVSAVSPYSPTSCTDTARPSETATILRLSFCAGRRRKASMLDSLFRWIEFAIVAEGRETAVYHDGRCTPLRGRKSTLILSLQNLLSVLASIQWYPSRLATIRLLSPRGPAW
jgi:hypothetical protein